MAIVQLCLRISCERVDEPFILVCRRLLG